MIRQVFTITSIPFSVTVPGTGDMPTHLVTLGGLKVTEDLDFSRDLRVFTFPSVLKPFQFTTVEVANGVRRLFTTTKVYVIPLLLVSVNGAILEPWLFEMPSNQTVEINTVEPPKQGDVIEFAGFASDSFTIGSTGEIRET